MKFEFEQDGPVDAKVMARAMKGCPKPKTSSGRRLAALSLGVLFGALLGAGGTVSSFLVLRGIGFAPETMAFAAPIAGGLFAFGVWKLLCVFSAHSSVKAILNSPIYSGGTKFDVSESGLLLVTDNASWKVKWPAMTGFNNTPDSFCFYAGAFVYVIPKSCVAEETQADFTEAVRKWRAAT